MNLKECPACQGEGFKGLGSDFWLYTSDLCVDEQGITEGNLRQN